MARYSPRFRTRRARGNPSPALPDRPRPPPAAAIAASLFLRHGNGELLASLAAAAPENLAARAGLHALAKSMRALATLAVRLERSLHDRLRDRISAPAGVK